MDVLNAPVVVICSKNLGWRQQQLAMLRVQCPELEFIGTENPDQDSNPKLQRAMLALYDLQSLGDPASRRLLAHDNHVPWLLVNGERPELLNEPTYIVQGYVGLLLEDVPLELQVKAIRAIGRGELWFRRSSQMLALRMLRQPSVDPAQCAALLSDNYDLTEREHQVCAEMLQGKTNKAIADTLHISPLTVKTHIARILGKMGVASRKEAIAFAMQHSQQMTSAI